MHEHECRECGALCDCDGEDPQEQQTEDCEHLVDGCPK